jgi:serine/threonine protein kinase
MTRPLGNLGAYELLRPLGAGGMAETFVALRRGPAGFEQRVCLKRILPGCAADPTFVELFLDEARLLARLQCRNIVHVYDFGETEGTYYMALELVEGMDLEGLLKSLRARGVRMSPSVALYVTGEVLAALSYAHTLEIDGEAQHIVHRDISPSNILISKNGEVKLTDFGIAKARGRSHRTQTGHTKGKVAYMSPEQMRAESVDGRSDLFAIGVVLFELLTGTHPFDANTDFALQLNIMNGKRPPLRELLPDAAPQVAELVDALLATDANQRPASAADAIDMIPSLGATFALQRELQQLVAGGSGSSPAVAPVGSRANEPGIVSQQRSSSQSAGDRLPVGARHTTTRKEAGSRLKPALWAALVALVLAFGYLFSRGDKAAPAASVAPTQPSAPAQLPAVPTPAAPAPDRAPQAKPPLGAPSVQADHDVATGNPVPSDEARASHRHHHKARAREGADHTEANQPTDPGSTRDSEPASTFVTAARVEEKSAAPEPSSTPPSTSMPSPGTQARAIIQAPRTNDKPEAEPRKAYVTPSGRVILPAPPLSR